MTEVTTERRPSFAECFPGITITNLDLMALPEGLRPEHRGNWFADGPKGQLIVGSVVKGDVLCWTTCCRDTGKHDCIKRLETELLSNGFVKK